MSGVGGTNRPRKTKRDTMTCIATALAPFPTNFGPRTIPAAVALCPSPTVQVILRAMRFSLNRGDYDLCEPCEVDHLVACLAAGQWTEDATDYAINILADAEDEIGLDATVAIGSIGAIRF